MIDRAKAQSQPEELRTCHDSMLRGRDAGDRVIAEQPSGENSPHLVDRQSKREMTPTTVVGATLTRGEAGWADLSRGDSCRGACGPASLDARVVTPASAIDRKPVLGLRQLRRRPTRRLAHRLRDHPGAQREHGRGGREDGADPLREALRRAGDVGRVEGQPRRDDPRRAATLPGAWRGAGAVERARLEIA